MSIIIAEISNCTPIGATDGRLGLAILRDDASQPPIVLVGNDALGVPVLEAEGVSGRRAAWSHGWDPDALADLQAQASHVSVVGTLPGDWRQTESI